MIVTIFPGPGAVFRVRDLDEGACTAGTVARWFCFYGDAVEYIQDMYNGEHVVSPDAFRQEIRKRRTHHERA